MFTQTYDFQRITQEQGLPSSSITCMMQDSRNLLWIGTDGGGLVRFDGLTYSTFDDPSLFDNRFITDIKEDSKHNLVLCTRYNGVSFFDGNKFFKTFHPRNTALRSESVWKVYPTEKGTFFFADNELFFIDLKYKLKILAKSKEGFGIINSVVKCNESSFLFSSDKGVFFLKGNKVERLKIFNSSYHTLIRKETNSVLVSDTDGIIWTLHDKNFSKNIYLDFTTEKNFHIKHLFLSRSGNLWLSGTNQEGIIMWNKDGKTRFNSSNGFTGSNVTFFYQDEVRNLYIGTMGTGLYRTGPQLFFNYSNVNGLNSSSIFGVIATEDAVYVGYNQENTAKYTLKQNGQLIFERTFENTQGTLYFFKTRQKDLIVCSRSATFKETKTGLNEIKTLAGYSIIQAFETDKHFLLGTYGMGLLVTDKNFNIISVLNSQQNPYLPDYVYAIHQAKPGEFYLASNGSLVKISEKNGNYIFTKKLINDVLSIGTEDSYGNFWYIGTNTLYSVSKKGKVKQFTKEKDGITSLLGYTLIGDNQGNIWLGSNKGIDKIQVRSNGTILTVKNYNSKNGFHGLETNIRAQFKDFEGNIYMGTANGLVKCMSAYKAPYWVSPDVVISSVSVLNKQINWKEINTSNKWFNVPSNDYVFKPTENQLSFEFTTVNAGYTDQFYFSYKLEGLDKNWSEPSTNQSVTYSNLRPGSYRFVVRLVDKNNETIKVSQALSFVIDTPFYASWWFILFSCIIAVLLIYILIKQSITYNKEFIKESVSSRESKIEQLRIYLLFLGILAPVSELIIELFSIRNSSELLMNLILGFLSLFAYLVTKKRNIFRKYLYELIISVYLIFMLFSWYKIITSPFELITVSEYFYFIFLAHILILNSKHYIVFLICLSVFLITTFFTPYLDVNQSIIISYISIFIVIIVQIKNIINNNLRERVILADKIVNNGQSIVITADKKGNISFISENVKEILGYEPHELLGQQWWEKTIDEKVEFENNKQILIEKIKKQEITTRLVKTKSGAYKWIQWHDKEFTDDLIVGIGQDVTDLKKLETEKEERQEQLRIQAIELEEYAKKLEFENTLKGRLMHSNSFQEVAQNALTHISSKLENVVYIGIMFPDKYEHSISGFRIFNGALQSTELYISDLTSYPVCKKGEIFVQEDISNVLQPSQNDLENIKNGISSYIAIPIRFYDDFLGILFVGFKSKMNLNNKDLSMLIDATDIVAISANRIRLQSLLKETNDDLLSSINYARTIQEALFPSIRNFSSNLENVGLFFKPKDLVSGDFYWAKEINDFSFIALGDCTGHGVPGAFLTLLGISFLEQIIVVEGVRNPAEILSRLDQQLFESLNKNNTDSLMRDGMEISICVINHQEQKLYHAGAGLGLLYFKGDEEIHLRGQRLSIGDYRNDEVFICNELIFDQTCSFFMATDGYQDQLGGDRNKRFSKNKLIHLLKELKNKEATEIEKTLENELVSYQGNHFQIDDITVIHFKIKTT